LLRENIFKEFSDALEFAATTTIVHKGAIGFLGIFDNSIL
jgi:hypothetical protein